MPADTPSTEMEAPPVTVAGNSSSALEKKIISLRKRIKSAGGDVMNILEEGRKAIADSKHAPLYLGMIKALDQYFTKLEANWDDLVDAYIEKGNDNLPSASDREYLANIKKCYYECQMISDKLRRQNEPSGSGKSNDLSNFTFAEQRSGRNLPKIQLTKFDGNLARWPKFRDTFVSLIHSDKCLSNMDKFHYLIASLTGHASSVIAHLPLEDANYETAWEAVKAAYNNKRLLAATYLNSITNFKPLTGKTNIESLMEFTSKISDSVSAFKLLDIADEADFILFHLAVRVLDPTTRECFEMDHKGSDFPTFGDLAKYVRERCTALQMIEGNMSLSGNQPQNKKSGNQENSKFSGKPRTSLFSKDSSTPQKKNSTSKSETTRNCIVCGGSHTLLNCEVFHQADSNTRVNLLRNWKGCRLCLSENHLIEDCTSKWRCRFCRFRHHSMLHLFKNKEETSNPPPTTEDDSPASPSMISSSSTSPDKKSSGFDVLLGTVLADVYDSNGQFQTVRMVLDSGSQHSFITQKCLNNLGLSTKPYRRHISGIGATILEGARGKVNCTLKPRNQSEPTFNTDAIVVRNITSSLPSVTLPTFIRQKLSKFQLADPQFWKSGPVDFLIGADLFGEVVSGSPIHIDDCLPKLFPSVFGNVIIGRFNPQPTNNIIALCAISDLNDELQKFWTIEEVKPPASTIVNPDDLKCELQFRDTHCRKADGRYIVHLPFKDDVPDNFDSSTMSLKRFNSLELRLKKDHELQKKYVEFMDEYYRLGHMKIAATVSRFIIPHHCVVNASSKLRVVFDASAKTASGSLNDYLFIGPKLQRDIRDVLMSFRLHRFVFVTDVVKMYRQIEIHQPHRQYQHVYWRSDPTQALQVFELATVTYGMAAAPFLALRVIQQLVEDEGHEFPEASRAIKNDMYVDDLATGAASIPDVLQLQKQIISLMKRGGFELSKWSSNCPEILKAVSHGGRPATTSDPVLFEESKLDSFVKILGLQWNPALDVFCYRVQPPKYDKFTKRNVLSTVAKLYDPLGFLAPTILLMKSFIQDLWKLGLDWDEHIPHKLAYDWGSILTELPLLSELRIPRFVTTLGEYQWQIVGFADASTKGYCGVIYLRIIANGMTSVHLLTAKSKLAPVKTLTIPRLELCGALLLTKLYVSIQDFLKILPPTSITHRFFTDSTVVLGWLNTPVHRLKTYVVNRVNEIVSIIDPSMWRHICSEQNPGDPGSRGLTPSLLINNNLWWQGPCWLGTSESKWPNSTPFTNEDLPEIKDNTTALISFIDVDPFIEWMSRFSSYFKLLSTIARIKVCVRQWKSRSLENASKSSSLNSSSLLSLRDIEDAERTCIRTIQLKYLFNGNPKNMELIEVRFSKLSPFIDNNNILRAGGRLKNSDLPYHSKYPIILPTSCHFTNLLVDYFHRIYSHPSPVLLQAMVQRRFWVPSLRRVVRQRTFLCMKCFKDKASPLVPRMGDLPSFRLEGGRAFHHVGTDFAGPFSLKFSTRRNAPVSKVYLCVYVCMTTKAIHLEAVTQLSTDAFLASFSRFIARRGLPSNVYSDCGTNYVGASNHLKEIQSWYYDPTTRKPINDHALQLGINWHFNPPNTPHMGGIWEGGVKSAKRLIRVIAGETPMTYEEISTLFSKIEAQLNSRPLCPLSDNPEDLEFLSPGHFLIGRPLQSLPEPSLLEYKDNLLSRWQLLQRMSQHFWQRWRSEYMVTLIQRPKWTHNTRNLKVGDLVLIKEDHSQPTQWPMARVLETHPGSDNIVRVATIKTKTRILKRPAIKLIPLLPLDQTPYPPSQ